MDALLDSLRGLLLQALPTLFLVIALHIYLKWAFYQPLDRILQERYAATEGARKAADASLARAEAKAAEYQESLRGARAELFSEQEEARKRLRANQAAALEEARHGVELSIRQARDQIAAEAARAKVELQSQSEALAEEIVTVLLQRKAS